MVRLCVTDWHPLVLSVTETVYVPALFTLIDGVVSPVFHMNVNGAMPPVVDAVKTTLFPEHIVWADWEMAAFSVHTWLCTRNDINKRRHIIKEVFINAGRSFLIRFIIRDK